MSAIYLESQKAQVTALRLLSGLYECFQCTDNSSNKCFKAVLSVTLLVKSLQVHQWMNEVSFYKFLEIEENDLKKLIGIDSVELLLKQSPEYINRVSNSMNFSFSIEIGNYSLYFP